MDAEQLERLRTDIKAEYQSKIDALSAAMNAELDAVSRIEARLVRLSTSPKPQLRVDKPSAAPEISQSMISMKPKTAIDRVRGVIANWDGEFSSMDIMNAANNDGTGKIIKKNTFFPIFSKLLNDKDSNIFVVREPKGSQPGIYQKSNDVAAKKII